MLLADQANEVYLTTGLDLTTSAVSDIYLTQIELDRKPPGLEIVRKEASCVPVAVLRANSRVFRFDLTLPRFEFLCRVADGATPSSFSRESCTDFHVSEATMPPRSPAQSEFAIIYTFFIDVQGNGTIQRLPIHLVEQ